MLYALTRCIAASNKNKQKLYQNQSWGIIYDAKIAKRSYSRKWLKRFHCVNEFHWFFISTYSIVIALNLWLNGIAGSSSQSLNFELRRGTIKNEIKTFTIPLFIDILHHNFKASGARWGNLWLMTSSCKTTHYPPTHTVAASLSSFLSAENEMRIDDV